MSSGRPRTHSDEAILDAVDELVEAGDRDLWEGGVRPETLADELDIPVDTARRYIRALVDDGELVRVRGACPEEPYHPRASWLPANHPDAQPPDP